MIAEVTTPETAATPGSLAARLSASCAEMASEPMIQGQD